MPIALYALSVFTGATLLFLIQPIVAKELLPWFGGAAAVWTACMIFCQTMLLLGYLYAHWSIRSLSRYAQALTHLSLLALSLVTLWLPVATPAAAASPDHPFWLVTTVLARRIGLPFLVLSSTSPLLQAWYSSGRDRPIPYRLFALSNFGSLLGLVAYPFLVEPALDLPRQLFLWRAGYLAFTLLCGLVAIRVFNSPDHRKHVPSPAPVLGNAARAGVWILLAACSSALLLAVTNNLCQEIAPIPMLWIAPLAVYLASFVICFDYESLYRPAVYRVLVPVALTAIVWVQANPGVGLRVAVPLCLACLFIACMFCHGQLCALKPESARLTQFYLCISCGGALGSLFVGLVAPALFSDFFELQIAVTVCLALALRFLYGYRSRLFLAVCGLSALFFLRSFLTLGDAANVTYRARSFYGALSLREENIAGTGRVRTLVHGGTVHGGQALDAGRAQLPRYYYGRNSGVGIALQRSVAAQRVGVVGLGSGTLAAYGRPGDSYRFYEINPLIRQLAYSQFTFLRNSQAAVDVVLGDARLTLESEPAQNFDTLVLDAFSGDAIPLHLLTREAFQSYLRHLKPDGVIAVHVSNRYLDLGKVVSGDAAAFGRSAVRVLSAADPVRSISAADWILVMKPGPYLRNLQTTYGATLLSPDGRPWTDQYSNILSVLK